MSRKGTNIARGPASRQAKPAGPAADAPAGGRLWLVGAAVILLAGILAYSDSFQGRFHLDDNSSLVGNPTLEKLWPITDYFGNQRPLGYLTLGVNRVIHNHIAAAMHPGRAASDQEARAEQAMYLWQLHATNLAIHLAAALALFGIVRRTLLLPRLRDTFGRASLPLATAVALLWVVHPLTTSAVTYIVQRFESQMAMLYLLTLYLTIRGATSRQPWGWYCMASITCLAGMLTKEIMVTAPVAILIYDRLFLAESWGPLFRRRWPLYVSFACDWAWLPLIIVVGKISLGPSAGFGMAGVTSWQYALSQTEVIPYYFRLIFWPAKLCLDYGWQFPHGLGDVAWQAPALLLILAAAITAFVLRPRWGFLGLWFFLILGPTSSIMPIADAIFEHRVYLPMAAIIGGVVLGAYWLARRLMAHYQVATSPAIAAVGMATVVCVAGVLGWLTWQRNLVYHSELGMWQDVVAKRPGNWRAQDSLGVATMLDYDKTRDPALMEEAIRLHRLSVKLRPSYYDGHYNLAVALTRKAAGDPALIDEALQHYREVLRLSGNKHARSMVNIAEILRDRKAYEQAEAMAARAVALDPQFPNGHRVLASILEAQGKLTAAAGQYQAVLAMQPDHVDAHIGLGRVYSRMNRDDLAMAHWQKARAGMAGKESQLVLNNLAWRMATCANPAVRDGPEAVKLATRACELSKWKDATAIDTLAAAYAEVGQFDQAVQTQQKALALLSASQPSDTSVEFDNRLKLYQSRQPFRDKK